MSGTPALALRGCSVGLSGAVPERRHWTEPAMDRSILEFVASLSAVVLQSGGRMVHGSHPAFTPVIVKQAMLHKQAEVRSLALVVSELWPATIEDYRRSGLGSWVDIITCPKVGLGDERDPDTRNASLRTMRQRLIEEMSVIVAVGGLLHDSSPFNSGVMEELELAVEHGIPGIVVGSLGGMAAELAHTRYGNQPLIDVIDTGDIGHCVHEVYASIVRRCTPGG